MNICLLWLFWVFVSCISSVRIIEAKSFKHGQKTGTVLFERNDFRKQCWTDEEFTILSSRRMFQDLLPNVNVIDPQNDQYIAHLMDYFHICLESVRRLSVGKTKHLMLKALADTLGGYLRAYILPITRHSYYAGNIKYRNTRMLFELFDELKVFLRTNGAGWSKPSQDLPNIRIPPIVITPPKTSVACNGLITYSASSKHDGDYRSFTFRKKRRSTMKQGHSRRAVDGYRNEATTSEVVIPLPILDNEAEPNSIALPFKTDSLQSLYSEKSAFILVKYYITSVKCITSRSSTKTRLRTFNRDFYAWLQRSVRRHLDDEKWYPAFGGVLRVLATLRESDIGGDIMKSRTSGTYQVMPKVGAERVSQADKSASSLYKGKGENSTMTLGPTELVIIALVSVLVIWLLVGLCLVCYKFLTKPSEGCPPCESKATPFAVLYENSDYCQPDTCPSKSRKGVVQKLKEWWRDRFGRCPGGCQEHADEERCLAAISYNSKDVSNSSSRVYPRKKYTKSTSAPQLGMPKGRTVFKHSVCYSSEGSTTYSDSPAKLR
ncbi:PREDICTED: uncharacterized protein LOC105456880 [Wasmannia auropunctata]|uniref:uncharacterized protein LOC105456880 n=1 Tax=Wasmannia auropunctata TaxID=64793 RepID=UPI0005ED8383|nr:PREDICTED: uncharacterized protein LOC105456880 [Wasmannia auropunctata]